MKNRFIILVPLIGILILIGAGCSPQNSNPNSQSSGENEEKNISVDIKNFAFSPASITIKAGTTVKWTNSDSAPHDVTSNANEFASKKLNTGDSYELTFDQKGTFPYYCSIHPSMKGTVTVE